MCISVQYSGVCMNMWVRHHQKKRGHSLSVKTGEEQRDRQLAPETGEVENGKTPELHTQRAPRKKKESKR